MKIFSLGRKDNILKLRKASVTRDGTFFSQFSNGGHCYWNGTERLKIGSVLTFLFSNL